MSLLKLALAYNPYSRKKKYSEEEIELALAWLNDQVTMSQVAVALKMKNKGGVYSFLAQALRQHHLMN